MGDFILIQIKRHSMKVLYTFFLLFFLTAYGFSQTIQRSQKSIEKQLTWVQAQLKKPGGGKVVFAAHRGDWRNAPENSIQGLIFGIEKGFDIVELDLKKTKDGKLIVMHDKTIDRTTTGTGKPEDFLLSDLKKFRLRNGAGHPTDHEIPTFEAFLEVAKGRVVVCIDKGFEYFSEAMALVNTLDMKDQVIFNIPNVTLDSLEAMGLKNLDESLMLNVLGFPVDTVKAAAIVASFHRRNNVVFHPTFSSDTIPFISWLPSLRQRGFHVWLNALWPEHNGGHDDDRAVERGLKDETWGWLVQNGATIIQTDRPVELKKYLVKRKLHPKF
jgi:glycerophosphoryl diester phosphodiesterase